MKKKLQEKAPQRYQDLSEEEKNNWQEYGCKQYKNLVEDEKQKAS